MCFTIVESGTCFPDDRFVEVVEVTSVRSAVKILKLLKKTLCTLCSKELRMICAKLPVWPTLW